MSFTERIKALFNEEVINEPKVEEPKVEEPASLFLDIKSGDKVFRVEGEELLEGAYIVEIVMEEVEGEMVESTKQIEDGEYTIEGGKVITIESDLIKSIKDEEVKEEEIKEEEVIVVAEDLFSVTVTETFEKMKSTIDSLMEEIKSLKSEVESFKNDFSTQLEEVKKLPAEKGVSFKKEGFKFNKTEKTDFSRLQELSSKYRK